MVKSYDGMCLKKEWQSIDDSNLDFKPKGKEAQFWILIKIILFSEVFIIADRGRKSGFKFPDPDLVKIWVD